MLRVIEVTATNMEMVSMKTFVKTSDMPTVEMFYFVYQIINQNS